MNYKLDNILKDLQILYIEDDKSTRKLISNILTAQCKKVIAVESAEDALEIYQNEKPDIILSDVDLPGINGIEMVKIIRKNNKTIPIILLTAHTEVNYLLDAVKLHLVDYITKPLDIKKLTLALQDSAKYISTNKEIYIKFISGAIYYENKGTVTFKEETYTLTSQETLFLKLLLENHHQTVSLEHIFETIWEFNEGSQSALRSLINKLRKKIGKETIINISKIGYRLILD